MMKFLAIATALAALTLGGCDQQTQTQYLTKYQVVVAPDSLYNCPVITKWPAVKNLTDLQVAHLLVRLAEDNKICKSSLDAIHAYYDAASKRINGK